MYDDDLQLGKLKEALSQTQKNVSEPQTGIEPATCCSPVRLVNSTLGKTSASMRIYQ